MNNNTILAIAFLLAGTLFTATVAMAPAAYAGGDNDNDNDNGDGNKQKVEEESAGSIADCDNNEVERAGFDCVAVAEILDLGLIERGPIENGPPSVPFIS
jgi:hypothetical protein